MRAKPPKGRGATRQAINPFHKQHIEAVHEEGIDEPAEEATVTQVIPTHPQTIINRVDSPDIGHSYSLNPYQGCEHGCIYCYARNSHAYWGYNAGLDFEQKIMVKENAPALLVKAWQQPNWEVLPIMLAGNTDVYQPLERKYQLTRQLLQKMLEYRHPVGVITKNVLILRDKDLLAQLAAHRLVHVTISITSMQEEVRRAMEPRTATLAQRWRVVETLSALGIPVRVMIAPVIPGLTVHELPQLVERAAEAGAQAVSYLVVRLNGAVGPLFTDWLKAHWPNRASKILHQIADLHGGQLNDSRFGTRMKGEGQYSDMIHQLFKRAQKQFFPVNALPEYNCTQFIRPHGRQGVLF